MHLHKRILENYFKKYSPERTLHRVRRKLISQKNKRERRERVA